MSAVNPEKQFLEVYNLALERIQNEDCEQAKLLIDSFFKKIPDVSPRISAQADFIYGQIEIFRINGDLAESLNRFISSHKKLTSLMGAEALESASRNFAKYKEDPEYTDDEKSLAQIENQFLDVVKIVLVSLSDEINCSISKDVERYSIVIRLLIDRLGAFPKFYDPSFEVARKQGLQFLNFLMLDETNGEDQKEIEASCDQYYLEGMRIDSKSSVALLLEADKILLSSHSNIILNQEKLDFAQKLLSFDFVFEPDFLYFFTPLSRYIMIYHNYVEILTIKDQPQLADKLTEHFHQHLIKLISQIEEYQIKEKDRYFNGYELMQATQFYFMVAEKKYLQGDFLKAKEYFRSAAEFVTLFRKTENNFEHLPYEGFFSLLGLAVSLHQEAIKTNNQTLKEEASQIYQAISLNLIGKTIPEDVISQSEISRSVEALNKNLPPTIDQDQLFIKDLISSEEGGEI